MKTVIFDIGNVLMTFDWWPYIYRLFKKDIADRVTDAIWKDGLWNELDRGVMPFEEIVAGCVAKEPTLEAEIRQAFRDVHECMFRRDYPIRWIRELKTLGYRTLFLSNYSRYLREQAPEVLDFLPELDGGVFSCEVHLCKPDPAIYACICEKYQLDPKECFFIDDNEDNIRSAKEFGLNAYLFHSYEEDYDVIMKELSHWSGNKQ